MNTIRRTWRNIKPLRMMSPYSTPTHQPIAKQLQPILRNRIEPPKLYAWTPADLSDNINNGSARPRKTEPSDPDEERRRIFVLGVGNIGRLYATFLAKLPNRPPITLVVHRRELLERWKAHPGIEMVRHGRTERTADFDIEWWTDAPPPLGPAREPGGATGIANLVVATKAADALPQVARAMPYLGAGSTVAFTQNGVCRLWPPRGDAYLAARLRGNPGPRWLACVTTHGVTSRGPFASVLASPAAVLVGAVRPDDGGGTGWVRSNYLAGQIVGAPGLAARAAGSRELWAAQLEKLVVNSVINPLTAVLRCKNGEVFRGGQDGLAEVIDMLVEEASRTLAALVEDRSSDVILLMQEGVRDGKGVEDEETERERLENIRSELLERFSAARLRAMLYNVGAKVADNKSSMLQDVVAGKKTEIEDFNGWLVETAKFLGDERGLPTHEKLISLVEKGVMMTRGELNEYFLGSRVDAK
ncbi:6-phosphogluconate dehydrogenase C-terminal domain-like protein [Jackrogersella minutella]|nr:6-phosphogluconate dehydrogenase C-terminal domain-like protein [Jackrogersella minutella]